MSEVSAEAVSVPVCRHWNRQGFCLYGDKCKFQHPEHIARSETVLRPDQSISAIKDLRSAFEMSQKLTEASGGKQISRKVGNGEEDSSHRPRNKVRKCGRAGIFRRWLLDNFGKQLLCKGTGVLEVAGGKGELAFELVNLNNIPCTVVDPRKPEAEQLESFQRKLRNGFYHRTAPLLQYVDNVYCETIDMRPPQHFRMFFDDEIWQASLTNLDGGVNPAYDESCKKAMRAEWTHQGLVVDEAKEVESREETIPEWYHVAETFRDCSVIVGLHPDQAVEAIIDFALATNKPFAVLPCCVYSKEFPKRQLRGKPVRKYEELVEYLVAKAPTQIGIDILGFEGRNILLYSKNFVKSR
jgi:hypothetical protein